MPAIDIAPNFSNDLSINFTVDRPDIDGPCDTPTCVDPANVDRAVTAPMSPVPSPAPETASAPGVAPDATIVNVRAARPATSSWWETVKALVYAATSGSTWRT